MAPNQGYADGLGELAVNSALSTSSPPRVLLDPDPSFRSQLTPLPDKVKFLFHVFLYNR